MNHPYSLQEIQKLLKIPEEPSSVSEVKLAEFFQLYKKATVSGVKKGEPCGDDEDCTDLLSDCCSAILTTVFGSLPLEVECIECGERYILREVISQRKS